MSDQRYPSNQQPQGGQRPYGAQQPYGGQQPQGQQPYGAQQPYGGQGSYGYQQPYGGSNMYASGPPEQKSSVLGIIGLGLVVVCAVALIAAAAILGNSFGDLMATLGLDAQNLDENALANDPRFQQFVANSTTLMLVAQAACFVGFVGWIISIVATATKRGRGAGIFGIILGVLAPIVAIVVAVMTMMPAITALIG